MINEKHIVSSFDRDLESVQALVMKMGGLVEAAMLDAAQALDTRDEELAAKVRANDSAIDGMEDQIQHECARLIALRTPAATDLRTVLSVMRIAGQLERCGDYAKNLAKRSLILSQLPQIDGATGSIRRMSRTVVMQLKDIFSASSDGVSQPSNSSLRFKQKALAATILATLAIIAFIARSPSSAP